MKALDNLEIIIGFLMIVMMIATPLFLSFFAAYIIFFAGMIPGGLALKCNRPPGGLALKCNCIRFLGRVSTCL